MLNRIRIEIRPHDIAREVNRHATCNVTEVHRPRKSVYACLPYNCFNGATISSTPLYTYVCKHASDRVTHAHVGMICTWLNVDVSERPFAKLGHEVYEGAGVLRGLRRKSGHRSVYRFDSIGRSQGAFEKIKTKIDIVDNIVYV